MRKVITLPTDIQQWLVLSELVDAVHDPVGCRAALRAWAADQNWPTVHWMYGTIPEGMQSWHEVLQKLAPIQLGYLWMSLGAWDDARSATEQPERAEAQCAMSTPVAASSTTQERSTAMPFGKSLDWRENAALDIEPGLYLAEITDVSEVDNQYEPGVERLAIHLALLDEQGRRTGKDIRAYCNAKWGPKATLFRWAQQVLGKRCPGPGQPFQPDTLIGRRCAVQIDERETPNGPRPRVSELYHPGVLEDQG